MKNSNGNIAIADGYFWVFGNTDYGLKTNPDFLPTDIEECTPSVEIKMLVNGKSVKICKKQERKVTNSNGTKKIELINSFFVNRVPMDERDMFKTLSAMGFDFEKFVVLTNPDVFLSEKKDIQRRILLSMASAYTDLDIANKMDGVDEAKKLLVNFRADEIRAMHDTILKKIAENYGQKGELLKSRIETLEQSKADMDFDDLELQKNLIKEKIELNQNAHLVVDIIENQLKELEEKDKLLQLELSELEQREQAERKAREEKKTKLEAEDCFPVDQDDSSDKYISQKEAINKKIKKNNKLIAEKKAGLQITTLLKSEELKFKKELRDCENKLSKVDNNIRIDEMIAELRKQQVVYEQERADAEKILYQLDLIRNEKNYVVTEEINKHFSLVHWKMFDFLNSSYTETCIPMIGDTELWAELDNALQIRAKIDICNSLQNFYDIHYPIILDNSEFLDSKTVKQLEADTQLILL